MSLKCNAFREKRLTMAIGHQQRQSEKYFQVMNSIREMKRVMFGFVWKCNWHTSHASTQNVTKQRMPYDAMWWLKIAESIDSNWQFSISFFSLSVWRHFPSKWIPKWWRSQLITANWIVATGLYGVKCDVWCTRNNEWKFIAHRLHGNGTNKWNGMEVRERKSVNNYDVSVHWKRAIKLLSTINRNSMSLCCSCFIHWCKESAMGYGTWRLGEMWIQIECDKVCHV